MFDQHIVDNLEARDRLRLLEERSVPAAGMPRYLPTLQYPTVYLPT